MAGNMTICSFDRADGKRRLLHANLADVREAPAMSQPMIAALVAVGVIALALVAVLRLMRPRQVTLPDYPELPPPPKDDGQGPKAG